MFACAVALPAAAQEGEEEPRLRFSFRFQQWVDVLEYVAEHAGLSLVLEAPPPGTFNYADTREYTPAEAIDLINGVLVRQGFTLVTRDRMLIVVDLSREMPEGFFPQVTMEQLDERGDFEMVTVYYRVTGKDFRTVADEVEPLLGPFGRMRALSASRNLVITDTVQNLRVIRDVIEDVPPPPPRPPRPPEPKRREPERPRLRLYEVTQAEAETLEEAVTQLLGGRSARFVMDRQHGNLIVHTVPSHHAIIERVLDQIREKSPAELAPRLEVYEVADIDPAAMALAAAAGRRWERPPEDDVGHPLVDMVRAVAPAAELSFDLQQGRLVAWAEPKAHKSIREVLDTLRAHRNGDRRLQVHRTQYGDPAELLSVLEAALPEARLSAAAGGEGIVAYATADDHRALAAMIEQLDDPRGRSAATLRVYPVEEIPSTALRRLLRTVAPGARIVRDLEEDRILVTATAADHARIVEAIGRDTAAAGSQTLHAYPLAAEPPANLLGTLAVLAPRAALTLDESGRRLFVSATAADHEAIRAALEAVREAGPGESRSLAAYPLELAEPSAAIATLAARFPEAQITHEARTGRLLVWADPTEQAAIEEAVAAIDGDRPAAQRRYLDTYRLAAPSDENVLPALRQAVPGATLSFEARTRTLTAHATSAEHDRLATALDSLAGETALEGTPQMEVHPLPRTGTSGLLAMLRDLFPRAELRVDDQTRNLLVLAPPETQRAVRRMLSQLDPSAPRPDTPQLRSYPLPGPVDEALVATFGRLAPAAEITHEADRARLLVLATEADHESLARAIEAYHRQLPLAPQRELRVYPLAPRAEGRLQSVLEAAGRDFEGVEVVTAGNDRQVAVWALPGQHTRIAEVFAELNGAVDADRYRLLTFTTERSDPEVLQEMLEASFPGVRVVLDRRGGRLLIRVRNDDYDTVRAALVGVEGTPLEAGMLP